MAPFFSPQPRFRVVEHSKGPVLVITVARVPSLVPCVESRQIKYFLRINQTTLEAPEYLISDLILGRRQHPLIDLHTPRITEGREQIKEADGGRALTTAMSVIFSFVVENLSLITAEDVKVGAVFRSLVNGPTEDINRHLRGYLDIDETPIGRPLLFASSRLVHRSSVSSGKILALEPFHTLVLQRIGPFYFPQNMRAKILGAVYVISKGAPPTWFQIDVSLSDEDFRRGTIQQIFNPLVTRRGVERSKVAWMELE